MKAKVREGSSVKVRNLVEIARNCQSKPKSWLDALDADDRSQVIEICNLMISGEITATHSSIREALRAQGLYIPRDGIQNLVARIRAGGVAK